MARSRRSRRTLTVVVLVVLSLSLISLDLNGRTHSVTSGIKSVANDVFSPLRQGVLDIISPIGSFFAGAFDYHSVQAQNEQLQRTIGQLRAGQSERSFEQAQLRQLMALQNLPFLAVAADRHRADDRRVLVELHRHHHARQGPRRRGRRRLPRRGQRGTWWAR